MYKYNEIEIGFVNKKKIKIYEDAVLKYDLTDTLNIN